jgi:hypothetical protein
MNPSTTRENELGVLGLEHGPAFEVGLLA